MDEESNEGGVEVFNPEIVMVKSWTEKVNISQLCRICANTSDCLISIFEGEGVEHELSSKINKHLHLKVTPEDKLPKNVCYPCASTLIAWHDMSISCVEADKKLHSLIDDLSASAASDDEFCDDNQSMDLGDYKDDADLDEKVLPVAEGPESLTFVDVSTIKKGSPPTPKSNVIKARGVTELSNVAKEDFNAVRESDNNTPDEVTKIKSDEASTSVDQDGGIKISKPSTEDTEESSPLLKPKNKNEKRPKNRKKNLKYEDRRSDGSNSFKIYQCDKCSLRFEKKCRLLYHLKVHTDKKDFICHICAKPFHRRYNLKLHIERIHLGLKNHICDICGQGFADKYLLKDHRRRHTGEKPYMCDVCGKSFISFSSIRSHRKTHKDEFPFPCSVCGHKFRFRQNLRDHFSLHTNEKKYSCEICGQNFRQSNSLNRHKAVHSDDKPYTCTVCSLSFKMMRYLKRHLKSKHPSHLDTIELP